MKIHPMEAKLFHTDRQTDLMNVPEINDLYIKPLQLKNCKVIH